MTAMPPFRKRPDDKEFRFQKSVADYLWRVLPADLLWWHTPNGGKRGKITAGKMKAMGVRAGIPDLSLWWKGDLICIELKVDKTPQSQSQKDVEALLTANGATYGVARTLDEVEAILIAAEIPLKFLMGRNGL